VLTVRDLRARVHVHGVRAALLMGTNVDQRGGSMSDDRCPYVSTDAMTTRYPREDGWRCGETVGHDSGHVLYAAHGESVLYSSGWELPVVTS
jgi:hypothetical protein